MKTALERAHDARGPVAPGAVAACAFSAVPGFGPVSFAQLVAAFGTLEEALLAGAPAIVERARAGGPRLRDEALAFLSRDPDLPALGLRAIEAARAAGAWVATPGDPRYPELLQAIEAPPPVLYVRGTLRAAAPRIAIVGARDADDEGLAAARQLAGDFARAGVEVVSGGARGVDAAAHAGALWGEGATVAVLGCGIDVVYPPEHGALFDRVAAAGGAVVSEFPPGTGSGKANFPRRNRTISGLSSAVVVVRAAERSGALITASCAAAQGRPVFAVPGIPDDPICAGSDALLASGAGRAAASAASVLRDLGWPLPPHLEAADRSRGPTAASSNRPAAAGHRRRSGAEGGGPTDASALDEVSGRLWGLLDERRPLHLDELAARGGVGPDEALRTLQDLELKGLCLHRPGKYYLRRTP